MMEWSWTWHICEYDTLPIELPKFEADGWVIFAIIPTGSLDRYCRVIVRRKRDAGALLESDG